jgi:hypothetical protein
MWPLLVPVGRGGASGKALAVGAAPRAGGAEGVLQPACLPLRKAFDDTMRDPSFVAEAEARKIRVYPTGGAQLTDILAKAYATPSAIVRRTMQAMGRES